MPKSANRIHLAHPKPRHFMQVAQTGFTCPIWPTRLLRSLGSVAGYYVQDEAGDVVEPAPEILKAIEATYGPAEVQMPPERTQAAESHLRAKARISDSYEKQATARRGSQRGF